MAKKVTNTFIASLAKNTEKSGAWLCNVAVRNELGEVSNVVMSAWANASAGKRWVKSELLVTTGRKSIKLSPTIEDENGKPTFLMGSIDFKVQA